MFHVYHCFRIAGSDSDCPRQDLQAPADGCLVPVFTTSLSTDCAGTVSAAVTGRLLPADVTTVMSAQVSWSSLHSPGHTTDAACCPGRVLVAVTTVSCPHALSRGPAATYHPHPAPAPHTEACESFYFCNVNAEAQLNSAGICPSLHSLRPDSIDFASPSKY